MTDQSKMDDERLKAIWRHVYNLGPTFSPNEQMLTVLRAIRDEAMALATEKAKMIRAALEWCCDNDGDCLGDHASRLKNFRGFLEDFDALASAPNPAEHQTSPPHVTDEKGARVSSAADAPQGLVDEEIIQTFIDEIMAHPGYFREGCDAAFEKVAPMIVARAQQAEKPKPAPTSDLAIVCEALRQYKYLSIADAIERIAKERDNG